MPIRLDATKEEEAMLSPVLLRQVLFCVAVVWSADAFAQTYPSRPITLVVPYAAGSGIDVMARKISASLSPRLGQPIVIDNRPGAASVIGSEFVAKSAPDGYTLMYTANLLPVLPALYKKLPFDPVTDFTHISKVGTGGVALLVNPRVLPVKSLDELVAKARAQPGKLNFSSSGIGTPHHLGMEALKDQLGMDIVHVPYRGSPAALNDLLAGHVQLALFPVNSSLAYIKSGALTVLAISSKDRDSLGLKAPSFEELGLKKFENDIEIYFLLSAPAKLPSDIVQRLNREIATMLDTPEQRNQFLAMSVIPERSTPEEISAQVAADVTRWKGFIATHNISMQ
jgi:tripartite-type tricarboxylate transporter receptor subunit TctC